MCTWCNARDERKQDKLFAEAVCSATRSFVNQPGSLSTIRNAGWEQTFRNALLTALEAQHPDTIGFTEATAGEEGRRVDLVLACGKPKERSNSDLLAVELKINFSHHGPNEINRRAWCAAEQLLAMKAKADFPRYLVYVLTHPLQGQEPGELVELHNRKLSKSTAYKRFLSRDEAKITLDKLKPTIDPDKALITVSCDGGSRGGHSVELRVWAYRHLRNHEFARIEENGARAECWAPVAPPPKKERAPRQDVLRTHADGNARRRQAH